MKNNNLLFKFNSFKLKYDKNNYQHSFHNSGKVNLNSVDSYFDNKITSPITWSQIESDVLLKANNK